MDHMKQLIKRAVEVRLQALAKKAIQRYQPIIIGVAGSVGKTSTKEAIFSVLAKKMSVRKSTKSYNNEFGVPLAVLGLESGYNSPLKWMKLLFDARRVALGKDETYPKVLVLEMGSDHVGDVEKLMRIAPPSVGVLTAIAPVHLEFFGSFENVKKEESTIVRNLSKSSCGIINGDDEHAKSFASVTPNPILYGLSEECDVFASDIKYFSEDASGNIGIRFLLHIKGEAHEAFLPLGLGKTHLYSALAAVAVGNHLNVPAKDIVLSLLDFAPPPGRMRCLEGIKHTKLIDDTYNSSPRAVEAALQVLKDCPAKGKRYAVLGDMAELGKETESLHREVGKLVLGNADVLITVGEKARDIAFGAREAGMSEDRVYIFSDPGEAGKFLQERLHQGDVALVKGSQAVRLEKIVKEVMAEPAKADEFLVRQEEFWR